MSSVVLSQGSESDPVEVRPDDAVLGRGRREPLEPRRARGRPTLRTSSGSSIASKRRPQLGELRRFGVALAELVLDRLQLLAEEELALALLHLLLDLRLDLRAELEHLELAVQDRRDLAQPRFDVRELEQALLLVGLQAQRRGDEIAERARIVDVRRCDLQLFGEVGNEADDAGEEVLDVARERFDLRGLGHLVRQLDELADEIRIGLHLAVELAAFEALDEDAQRPVGNLDHLVDDCGGADLVEVVPAGLVGLGVLHGDEREQAVARDDVLDELDRALLSDRERRHGFREDDRVLQRQDRQRRGKDDLFLALLGQRVRQHVAHRDVTTIAMRSAGRASEQWAA